MKNKNRILRIGLMLGLIILLSVPSTLAWSINPAKWTLYHKEDYEIEKYEWPLELKNDGEAPIDVKLSVMEPEYLYEGNERIPDLDWVSISKKNLTIEPKSKERVFVTIEIENKSEAYNESWEFWILADQTAGAGNIQTDYRCRWTLITPEQYVPVEERPGYIPPVPWSLIIGMLGTMAGIVVVISILYKKDVFKKKKPSAEIKSKREQKEVKVEKEEEEKPKASKSKVVKYNKRG
jgi:hypothetical protein